MARFVGTYPVGLLYTIISARKTNGASPVDSALHKFNFFILLENVDISIRL
jgi:hypothetical protein